MSYLSTQIVNALMGTQAFIVNNMYAALFNAGGLELAANVATGYVRLPIPLEKNASNQDQIINAAAIVWTTQSAWGQIASFVVYDALTGGNQLFKLDFTTPLTVESGIDVGIQKGVFMIDTQILAQE